MPTYDDNQNVGEILKGKSPQEQQKILQQIAEQVVTETGLGNGVDYDFKNDFRMKVVIDSNAIAAYSDIRPPGDEDYCGSLGCLKGKDDIHIDPKFANILTVRQLKSVYAHELEHVDQLDLPLGKISDVLREVDSDHAASQKYGAQTTIEVLEKAAKLYPQACTPPHGDPHPSIAKREQATIAEFPEAHLPSPSACPVNKNKSVVRGQLQNH